MTGHPLPRTPEGDSRSVVEERIVRDRDHFWFDGHGPLAYDRCIPTTEGMIGDHNCIPVRRWFRQRWVCVRCNRVFRAALR